MLFRVMHFSVVPFRVMPFPVMRFSVMPVCDLLPRPDFQPLFGKRARAQLWIDACTVWMLWFGRVDINYSEPNFVIDRQTDR